MFFLFFLLHLCVSAFLVLFCTVLVVFEWAYVAVLTYLCIILCVGRMCTGYRLGVINAYLISGFQRRLTHYERNDCISLDVKVSFDMFCAKVNQQASALERLTNLVTFMGQSYI